MIKVNEEYMQLTKDEYNNYQHKYKIINLTRNKMNLEPLLISESLRVNRFLRTARGTLTPNNVKLQFEGKQGNQQDFLVKDFLNRYKDFPNMRWKDIITVEFIEEYLIKNQDIIEIIDIFNGKEITIFKGQVREVTRIDTDNRRTIDITIEDNTIKGYENTFSEEKVYENHYISNNNEKDKSILHILSKMIGFNDNELHIADVKLKGSEYIKIPLIKCEKGKKIMEEIAEIVRAIYGNIYTLPNGKLRITSDLDKSYIEDTKITIGSKDGNYPVLSFIENTEIQPKENKVEVKYNNVVKHERQAVFVLSGQNAVPSEDDAKVKIPKNSEGKEWWKIELNNVVNIERTPHIVAYKIVPAPSHDNKIEYATEEVKYTDYELLWEDNGLNAKLRFNNKNDYDIYIKEFKIYGDPITSFKDNSILYTEIKGIKDYNLKQVTNKYINSKELATEIAKHTYYNECRTYSRVKLQTNNMPFLSLEDIVHLDYNKYKGDYQIIAITQTESYTELLLKLYREYQAYAENFITEIIAKNNKDLLESKVKITKEEKEKISENDKAIKELKTIIEDLQASTNTKLDKIAEQMSVFASFLEEYKKIEPKLSKIVANFNEIDYMTKNEVLIALQKVTNKKEFDTLFNSKRIKRMIVNNQDLMLAVSQNNNILNVMYNNYKKINSGARQSVSGGKYIILEVSNGNAYSSSYGETRRNGSTLSNWGDYKGKFQYFKKYPNYVDYIRNDTESDDWVYYYDFEI
ncbi:hypothetical protein [uncultured Sneathia sp.]|uniref:hypothetical protein n=1 Tax=uncultured Sneathia sp. TaxID=278067 RepID=UPI002594264A|nr:hypothetical protein [uncultured Sneathia sp.]